MKEACWNNRPAYEVVCKVAVSKCKDNTYPIPEFLRRDALDRMQAELFVMGNDLGNRRDAGPIGGASVLTDELAGNG